MSIIQNPVEQFFDLDGSPLKDGYIYCGNANTNPETNPVQIYADDAFTIPISQPIRTTNGYPVLNGTPVTLYSVSGVSIQVRNKKKLSVFYAANTSLFNLSQNISNRTANAMLVQSDNGKTIVATGTFTQTFDAASNLGIGWGINYYNAGSGIITFDPNLSELIDGLNTEQLLAGQGCYIYCTGTGFTTSGLFKKLYDAEDKTLIAKNVGNTGQGISMINGTIVVTASGALTIALKTLAGADPSVADPVIVNFETTTAVGSYAPIKITSALSLVVSAGSTLGTLAATPATLWVVMFNDSGTPRLGVVNLSQQTAIGDDVLATSIAEGGAGAADSAGVFYTGTAVTNRIMKVLAYITLTQAAPGSWVTAPTAVVLNQGTNQILPTVRGFSQQVLNNFGASGIQTSAVIANGIPFNARRITLMLNGWATNGNSPVVIQAGNVSGYASTTYDSVATTVNAGTSVLSSNVGVLLRAQNVAATINYSKIVFDRIDRIGNGTNSWQVTSSGKSDGTVSTFSGMAYIVVGSSDLTQLQITTLGGVNQFTFGAAYWFYET